MAGRRDRRVAVVTGAGRGIGLEVVRQLAAREYVTVLCARDESRGAQLAERLSGEGTGVLAHELDVTDEASVERLRDWLRGEFGAVDVLVNNAGILYDTWQLTGSADLDTVRRALETNLLGAWQMCAAVAPLMVGGGSGRRIVNVSSGAGSFAEMGSGTPAYGVSKAALNAFTRKLALELRGTGVLVNAVCPGWVATDMGGSGGRPVAEGAASVVWAVTIPDDGPTGGFFRDGRAIAW